MNFLEQCDAADKENGIKALPAKFAGKSVTVEAMLWEGGLVNYYAIERWAGPENVAVLLQYEDEGDGPQLTCKTLEGPLLAAKGDYIIKGTIGEFYPCKPDVFESKYFLIDGSMEAMMATFSNEQIEFAMDLLYDTSVLKAFREEISKRRG
jgi:hypothetical protein